MENGVVHVWDAEALVKSSSSSSSSSDPSSSSSAAVIVSFTQHASGPVKSLHFNSLVPSQLATGGSDGAVFIVDLSKHNDVPLTPNADPSQQQRSAIMALAWNTEVAHILASAASDGTVAIWDTQARKRWCELHCGNEAVTAVNWNPTQGMQLLTASYDDRSPIIKLWDLRSSTSMPLATLAGHTKGILGMAWCPHDEHLLMS
jgi:protein transport protein SEC31